MADEQSVSANEETIVRLRIAQKDILEEYLSTNSCPWIIGYSGGKDSTLIVQLVFEMLINLAPSDRKRYIYILCNDTLVESPILSSYIESMLIRLQSAADSFSLPIKVIKTVPNPDQTFWVNLIGRGYPSPTRMFRWCTDRMKIAPTSSFIKNQISETGNVILLLGVRRAESANRAKSIKAHENIEGSRLNPHDDLKGCLVFRPILEMTNNDVWLLLLQRTPPWGGNHRELVTLYRNAQGGECPLVVDKSTAPSCGSSSSRFGCWTCTVVEKDRSMEAMIEAGNEHLEPLMDFRDWLAKFRNERSKRMVERRNGRISLMGDGITTVAGPFTVEARQEILARLLEVQKQVGMTLINEDEISRIQAMWADDAVEDAKRHLKQREQLQSRKQA